MKEPMSDSFELGHVLKILVFKNQRIATLYDKLCVS